MDLIKLTQKLIKKRSEYPNEEPLGKFMIKILKDLGFSVALQFLPNTKRFNILATRGTGNKAILFYGHLDTVPLSNESMWKHKPFGAEIVKNNLYGLGSYDMKGGIAAFLEALRNTRQYTKILLAFDEEYISEGAWLAVRERRDFFREVDLVISPEPNFALGINNISTSRPGRSVYEIKLKGNAAHVAQYVSSKDAVSKLGEFIEKFNKTFYKKRVFKSPYSSTMIRRVFSESVGITGPFEAIVQIELYLDQIDSEEKFLNLVESIAHSKIYLIQRKTPYLKSYKTIIPHKKVFAKIIQKNTKKDLTNFTRSSVGDDNVLASLGIPILSWGPDGGNAHTVDEFVNLPSLEILSRMFVEFLNERSSI